MLSSGHGYLPTGAHALSFAGFALCLLFWRSEHHRAQFGPKPVIKRRKELVESYVQPKREVEVVRNPEKPRTIYRFPIHQLARVSVTESTRAVEPDLSW